MRAISIDANEYKREGGYEKYRRHNNIFLLQNHKKDQYIQKYTKCKYHKNLVLLIQLEAVLLPN